MSRQNVDTIIETSLTKILSAEEYSKARHDNPYIFKLTTPKAELFYFGAYHCRKPDDPIFKEIEKSFNDFKPDAVFVEGLVGLAENRDWFMKRYGNMRPEEAIDLAGESGFTTLLAFKNDIFCDSPEPDDKEIFEHLLSKGYSKDEVFLHEFIKILPQYHRQMNRYGFKEYVSVFLDRMEKKVKWPVFDFSYERGLSLARKLWGEDFDPETDTSSKDKIDPIPWKDKRARQTIINEISRTEGIFRDQIITKKILESLQHYSKVFVVYGASHAYMEEPAFQYFAKEAGK